MRNLLKKVADAIINGIRFQDVKVIKITNSRIYIDGDEVTPDAKNISISVEGDLEKLEVDSCGTLTVKGNVEWLRAASADMEIIGDVNAIATASGDVDVQGSVNGSITTASGDVQVGGSVKGRVNTLSGDIDCECQN